MRRVLWLGLTLSAVVALGWWALRAQPSGALPRVVLDPGRPRPQGDYFVVAVPIEPPTLNPFTAAEGVARRSVLSYTHDALLHIDGMTGALAPSLATVVESPADGRTHVLELRAGVRFSDGTPLGMADVLFTWELAAHDLSGSMWSDLHAIESVRALDERRLQIVLAERSFAGLGLAATAWTVAQRRFFEQRVAALAAAAGEPVPAPSDPAFGKLVREITESGPGTGPYQLARDARTGEVLRSSGDVLLVQNPHSWRARAEPESYNLAGLKLLVVRDPVAVRSLLRAQEIDWTDDAGAVAALAHDRDLAAHYDLHEYGYATLGPVFVVWNHRHPALRDRRVRMALGLLFDRSRLLQLRGGCALPAASWFLPGTPRAAGASVLPFDVERARGLLAEAGFGDAQHPLELTVLTIGLPEYEQILDLVVPDFARAGVTLHKRVVELAVLGQAISDRQFDGFVYAWNFDVFNDPTEVFHSTRATHNWMGYADPDMDRALDAARAELDEDERVALYHEFNRVFERDQPITLLYHRRIRALLHKRFRNVEVGALGLSPRRWWVEPGDQRHRWGVVMQSSN